MKDAGRCSGTHSLLGRYRALSAPVFGTVETSTRHLTRGRAAYCPGFSSYKVFVLIYPPGSFVFIERKFASRVRIFLFFVIKFGLGRVFLSSFLYNMNISTEATVVPITDLVWELVYSYFTFFFTQG